MSGPVSGPPALSERGQAVLAAARQRAERVDDVPLPPEPPPEDEWRPEPPEDEPSRELPRDDDVPDAELADLAAQLVERTVVAELRTLRAKDEARRRLAAELAGDAPPFDADLLVDVLARPQEPPHRVEGLIPSDAGTLVVAQRKTGKTTFELNLARSLIGGADFLGRFPVRAITGRVGLLNYEVSAAQLARWAHEAGVPADRLYMVNLRGRRNPLSHVEDRERLAEHLRRHEVESLIVDPFGRAFVGKSQNDSGEVGAFLGELDRWCRGDAGACDVVLTAHAGWNGERTRGASALEDWADVIVTLTRGTDEGDEGSRYLRAEGRDVLFEEDRLDFDPTTRRLSLSGSGSRKVAAKDRAVAQLVPAVVTAVNAEPGITGYKLRQALKDAGHVIRNGDENAAAAMAVEQGTLTVEDGPRRSKVYRPNLSPAPPAPTCPGQVDSTCPPAPYRAGGNGAGEEPLSLGQVDASDYTLTSAADTARRLFGDDASPSVCTVCGAPLRDATARRSGRCSRLDASHREARAAAS